MIPCVTNPRTVEDARRVVEDYQDNDLSFRATCKKLGFEYQDIWAWMSRNNPQDPTSLLGLYLRARSNKAHTLVDQIQDIADTEDDSQRARNRIQARQWVASRYNTACYGDKSEVHSTVSVTEPIKLSLEVVHVDSSAKPCIDNANVGVTKSQQG